MSKWLIVVLFLASMFLDGIILPAFFNFREGFLTIIFLMIMLLYYRADIKGLILGTALSWLAEFYWGLKMGTLMLPLLVSAGALLLLNKFFNIRSVTSLIFSGTLMFVVFWETSILINKIL